jgi:gluconate 5-dehydrogenase
MSGLFDLSGRVALVTGGSRGLGLEIARTYGRAGAKLAISARKPDELEAARAELSGEGLEVEAFRADLGDMAAADPLAQAVIDCFGQIDVLVNNAGLTWGAPAESHPHDAWRKVLAVNLDGVFALSQAVAAKSMLPRSQGSVIIVASVAGMGGSPAPFATPAYNASKAGAINLARALATEWGRRGVRVNALCPGWFPTKMSRGTLSTFEQAFLNHIPMGRFGDPLSEIGGPALFLASDASRYMTGAVLAVDGGITALS